MKLTTRKYRNFKDFKHGSFIVYVTNKEVVIRGVLKKTDNYSLYMLISEANG